MTGSGRADGQVSGAPAFNRLIGTLARSHGVETAMRASSDVLSNHFELEGLGRASLDALLAHTGAEAGALLVVREDTVDLGLAINNALAHDRLERLAAVDPLTDAYNRRFGLARLGEEFSRAVRAENPLGVLMFDLDHFKAINDTYGHLVGDRVLRAVARTCRHVLREGDVLVRYGGEAFFVLLPGAGAADVAEIGERVRRAVGETSVAEGDQRIAVTVSVGGATYGAAVDRPRRSSPGQTPRCTRQRKRGATDSSSPDHDRISAAWLSAAP